MTRKASGCEVELSRNRFTNREAFVSHANAALTPRARLRLAQLAVDGGWRCHAHPSSRRWTDVLSAMSTIVCSCPPASRRRPASSRSACASTLFSTPV